MKHKDKQQNLSKEEVLIALAAQENETVEQPPSAEELTEFFANPESFSKERQELMFAYLDSNPQAYNRWIQQGKQATQSTRAPLLFTIMPYAIASCAALLIIGTVLMWRGQRFELDQAVDQAYQMAASNSHQESFQRIWLSLADSFQQTEQHLSFSQAGKMSQSAQAFRVGIEHDWEIPKSQTSGKTALDDSQQEDYQLGRWYAVLWTVSQQKIVMPKDFWQEQLVILDHLQAHYTKQMREPHTAEIKSVAMQLENIEATLLQLTEDTQNTKLYKQLEQTLIALRYCLIPSL